MKVAHLLLERDVMLLLVTTGWLFDVTDDQLKIVRCCFCLQMSKLVHGLCLWVHAINAHGRSAQAKGTKPEEPVTP
jgi:hypothetical protein